MATYTYKLVTDENKLERGTVEARTKRGAEKQLKQEGGTVLELMLDNTSALRREIPLSFGVGFSKLERVAFFRNLSTMLGSGVAFTDALRVVADQTKKKRTKEAVEAMVQSVENGKPLSDAMEEFPKLFTPYLVETVRVGESTGRLPATMDRIATELEHAYELQREVQGQLAYPIVVVLVMLMVLVVMTFYVLPKIAVVFQEIDAELPLPTRILLGFGSAVQQHPLLLTGGFLALLIGVILAVRTPKGKRVFHTMLLKMPLFGEIVKEINLTRFLRAVESLYLSGISLVRGVEIAGKTVKNVRYREMAEKMHPLLLHGVPFTETLQAHQDLIPLQARRMLEMAERSGKMEEAFAHVNRHYEQSLRHRTKTLMAILEPTIMVGIGLVVGALALSLFLPLYETAYII